MDAIEEIKKLKALLDQGAITNDEFNSLKEDILSNSNAILTKQNSGNVTKGRGSSFFKKFIISIGVVALLIVGIFWVLKPDKSKEVIQNLSYILTGKEEQEEGYLYEDGNKMGKIVEVEIRGAYPHSGGGVTPLNVPQEKVWTPLYYEQISGQRNACVIQFFNKLRKGYSYDDYYEFDITKSNFVSAKFSKQNNDAIMGNGLVGIIITSYSNTRATFVIYFLEESY